MPKILYISPLLKAREIQTAPYNYKNMTNKEQIKRTLISLKELQTYCRLCNTPLSSDNDQEICKYCQKIENLTKGF